MKESRGMLQDKEAQPIIKNESTRSSNHDGVWCTYYKKPHHTKETLGRNGGFKGGQQRGQAHLTHAEGHPYENSNLSSSETEGFNKEEIERLGNLLNSLEKTNGSCSFVQSDKFPTYALSASNTLHNDSCVIDSGVTNHMTYSS
ncbi:hypothetical protein AAG906_020736 [Vitis piasezkii]